MNDSYECRQVPIDLPLIDTCVSRCCFELHCAVGTYVVLRYKIHVVSCSRYKGLDTRRSYFQYEKPRVTMEKKDEYLY